MRQHNLGPQVRLQYVLSPNCVMIARCILEAHYTSGEGVIKCRPHPGIPDIIWTSEIVDSEPTDAVLGQPPTDLILVMRALGPSLVEPCFFESRKIS